MPDVTTTNAAATHATTVGPRAAQLRRAIGLQGIGGLILTASIFLPAIRGCGSVIVPAEEIVQSIGSIDSLKGWGYASWITLPYLVGLNLFASAVRRRRIEKAAPAPKDFVTPALLVVWIANPGIFLISDFEKWGSLTFWTDPDIIIVTGSALIMCFYLACGLRGHKGWSLSVRWCALALVLGWFGRWIVSDFQATFYGIWLTIAGTMAMLAGVVWEAAIRSILPWRSALWGLIRCKLEVRDLDQPYCWRCGYCLVGLTSHRCPECGTAFESGKTGVSTVS